MIRVESIVGDEIPNWLEDDWRRLSEISFKPNFQLELESAAAWIRHLRGNWKLLLLLARRQELVVGIVPLMYLDQRRRGLLPFRRIRFLANTHTDFSTVLAARTDVEAVVEACLGWLIAGHIRWELLTLDDLQGADPATSAISSTLEKAGVSAKCHEGKYYFVDLNRPWDQVWADMSKKFVRRNVSLARNRLTKAGDWRRLDDPDWSIERILSEATGIHQPRQAELGRGSFYEDPAWRAYAQEALMHQSSRGRLRTHWLELNDVRIAYLIGFVEQRTYFAWNIAFLPSYAEFYPSRFLFAEIIRKCHDEGLKMFSFMRGESEYKAKWTSRFETNFRFTSHGTRHVYGKLIHLLEFVAGRRPPVT